MKTLLVTFALSFGLSALASPPPQQQDQQGQQQQHCPGGCYPIPRVYECHAQMIDCYGRPMYTYWARGPRYQGACEYAANLCIRDASLGYGGYGARCIVIGK